MGRAGSDVEAGFAKLQGEDFEYYMQTYSIVLGRNSKKSTVDVDLASLGGGMNISRHHARIFYDFTRRRFALEVLGKNGCFVEGVLHLPGNPPVKLDSQDHLQIGDKQFYFLLPVRSIVCRLLGPGHNVPVAPPRYSYRPTATTERMVGLVAAAAVNKGKGKGRGREYLEEEEEEEEEEEYDDDEEDIGDSGKKMTREGFEGYEYGAAGGGRCDSGGSGAKVGSAVVLGPIEKKIEGGSRGADREAGNQQLMQLEEKDVVSSVATVLSDLCGPGEWMPMERLHSELVEQYSTVWHHNRVRKYLTPEDWPAPEAKGKPWCGLLMLLRKYPEHFVINTRSKGRVTLEFVSLVSLVS